MNANREQSQLVATAERPLMASAFSDSNSIRRVPGSRRERLRSFARATGQVIKQEINKYYYADGSQTIEPENRDIQPSATETVNRPGIPRQRTQSMSDLTQSNPTEAVQPYCMLFPTYGCQAKDENQELKWKIRLAGWTYAKPGSSRIERWILAAGRTYGGLSANSAEDVHFARLLNQFRCQTMRGVDVHLYVGGLIPAELALLSCSTDDEDTEHHHHAFGLHHLRDWAHDALKTTLVNSGPSGRFDSLLMLDPMQTLQHVGRKMLRLKASFDNGVDSPHDGFVDLVEPTGISIISDIDDTIKVTGVLDGRDTILQNTFFRKANEVTGMSEVYRTWSSQGMHVHYVSNSPWQVYPALSEFIRDRHFPAGSMHLRAIKTGDLIRGKPGQHKLDVILQILQDFPDRKFILVGDSGERDPEIYQQIYKQYPKQVIKIFIHDVTSERAKTADKREGERSDSYYNMLRKFLARDQQNGSGPYLPRRSGTTTSTMLDALGDTEIPDDEKVMMDPAVPLKTKLDMFNERMSNLAGELPEGIMSVFTLASQLRTDPIVTQALWEESRKFVVKTPSS